MSEATDEPMVSVVVITYNHEAFIADALESICAQVTDFPFEVIVADDASTDATPEVIAGFADKFPSVIRPILRPDNLGIHANLISALEETRGSYVALCEGDDYWCDPRKLHKQLRVLAAEPDASLCFHPVRVTWTDDSRPDGEFPTAEMVVDLGVEALLRSNFIPTNSVLYRRRPSYATVPDVMPLDWYLHVLHATAGRIVMLPDLMAVYRRNPGGIWADRQAVPWRFWKSHASEHAALCEAFFELVGQEPARRAAIEFLAFSIAQELWPLDRDSGGGSLLMDMALSHPRWAALAMAPALSERESALRHLHASAPGIPSAPRMLQDAPARTTVRRLEQAVGALLRRGIGQRR